MDFDIPVNKSVSNETPKQALYIFQDDETLIETIVQNKVNNDCKIKIQDYLTKMNYDLDDQISILKKEHFAAKTEFFNDFITTYKNFKKKIQDAFRCKISSFTFYVTGKTSVGLEKWFINNPAKAIAIKSIIKELEEKNWASPKVTFVCESDSDSSSSDDEESTNTITIDCNLQPLVY